MPAAIPDWLMTAIAQLTNPAARHLITPAADLKHDLRLDHLAPLDLAEAILDATGEEVPAAAVDGWATVGDILATISEMHAA